MSQGYLFKYFYGEKSNYILVTIKNKNAGFLYLAFKVGIKNLLLGFAHSRFHLTPYKKIVILFMI
jgi:hypothetical protein